MLLRLLSLLITDTLTGQYTRCDDGDDDDNDDDDATALR